MVLPILHIYWFCCELTWLLVSCVYTATLPLSIPTAYFLPLHKATSEETSTKHGPGGRQCMWLSDASPCAHGEGHFIMEKLKLMEVNSHSWEAMAPEIKPQPSDRGACAHFTTSKIFSLSFQWDRGSFSYASFCPIPIAYLSFVFIFVFLPPYYL